MTVVFTGRRSPWGAVFRTRPRPVGRTRLAASGRMDGVSSPGPFAALPPQVDLPALEQEILQRWEADKVFARTLEGSAGKPQWVFYEGPPTANGRPGTHHIEARAFKDVFPRFKTMQGWHVPRRAGWDCHGLPVEIAVEQELGFAGKPDIERYGIAEFNARCRESVERHVGAFTELTRRMGYWVDMSTAYWTMNPSYIESVWWSLKQIFDKGLLVEDHRVAPYCPRCGTGLSDHEVAQGYETLTDPSVYVRLPITSGEWAGKADLLIWTTTPWTLPSNTAVADAPRRHLRRRPHAPAGDVPRGRRAAAWPPCWARTPRSSPAPPGRDWEYVHYQRPFELVDFPDDCRTGALRRPRRLRHHRGRHRAGAPVPRLRRRRPRRLPRATACRWSTRSTRPGTSCPTSRWSAATSSRPPTPRWSRT